VQAAEPGDSALAPGQRPPRFAGLRPAVGRPHLVGISRIATRSDGFLASASFQRAVEVLTEAALAGRTDELLGPKENVMLGRLIPAGTGLPRLREACVRERTFRPLTSRAAPRREPTTTEVR
jgi:hypothetical protein